MHDPEENEQFQGAKLESFRDVKTGSIRIIGADFVVLTEESGQVSIFYPRRTIRVRPRRKVVVEPPRIGLRSN